MSKRLKVLLSAYACEPNKGSEPEVGWQWALQMARFHEVTVLTRSNNRFSIEKELGLLRGKVPLPDFVYHEEDPLLLSLKKRWKTVQSYYVLWQKSAHAVVARLHREQKFDLLHHVTFAGYRYPAAIWGHGIPCIWGPIGGIESVPVALLPWGHPKSLLHELIRNVHNSLQALPFNVLPKRAFQSTLVLVSTLEMQQTFHLFGIQAKLVPTIGLDLDTSENVRREPPKGSLKLLFVGNIITLKGIDLALHALQRTGTDATFTLVGDGNYLAAGKKLVAKLGLESRVEFRGRISRAEVLKIYSDFDLFLFPSLHDTGGYAVIEAMSRGLPVICLDCGGPAVAVKENCGRKIPLGSRRNVIGGLAQAIKSYHENRGLVAEHGNAARASILENYDWKKKGDQMNEIYGETISTSKPSSHPGDYFWAVWKIFSLKQLFLTAAILFTVGMLGFSSVSRLKKKAELIVSNNLPGLSCAGAANANLSQAFNRTLLIMITENPQECANYRRDVEVFSDNTTEFLNDYKKTITAPKDEQNFNLLLSRREHYLQVRKQVFEFMDKGRKKEAIDLCKSSLLPAYNDYKQAGEVLLDYTMREGQQRGESIMSVCTITQFAVAGFVIAIFIIGFVIGLFR